MNCTKSPCGEHQYDINKYARDDQGFYLDCLHCGRTSFFPADTEDEFYGLFDMGDTDDDYRYEDCEE